MLKSIVLLLIGLLTAGADYLWFTDFFGIDSCLDGGGAWDYAKKVCRYQ